MAKRKHNREPLPRPKRQFKPNSPFSPFGAQHRWFKARVALPLIFKYGWAPFLFTTVPMLVFRYINARIGGEPAPLGSGELMLYVLAYGTAFALGAYRYQHYMAYFYFYGTVHASRVNRDAVLNGEVYGSPEYKKRMRVNKHLLFPSELELKYSDSLYKKRIQSKNPNIRTIAEQHAEITANSQRELEHRTARKLARDHFESGATDVDEYKMQVVKYRSRLARQAFHLVLPFYKLTPSAPAPDAPNDTTIPDEHNA